MSSLTTDARQTAPPAARAGTIRVVRGARAQVELDARPGRLTEPLDVAFGPVLAVGQRCAVIDLDSGAGLIAARWAA